MIPETFSTRSLRPSEQYEAWRERFQPVFEVTPKHLVEDGFAAENQIWTLGGLAVSRLSAPPVRVARKKGNLLEGRLVRPHPYCTYELSLELAG